jgi:hypothetical protein
MSYYSRTEVVTYLVSSHYTRVKYATFSVTYKLHYFTIKIHLLLFLIQKKIRDWRIDMKKLL